MAVKKTKKRGKSADEMDDSVGFVEESPMPSNDFNGSDEVEFDESKIAETGDDDTATYTMGDIQVAGAGDSDDDEEFKKASKAIAKDSDQDEEEDEDWSAEDFSFDDKDDFLAMEDYDLDNPEDDNY